MWKDMQQVAIVEVAEQVLPLPKTTNGGTRVNILPASDHLSFLHSLVNKDYEPLTSMENRRYQLDLFYTQGDEEKIVRERGKK